MVCGYETVASVPAATKEIDDSRNFEDGEFTYELSKNFTTDGGTDCPITSIALFEDVDGKTAYTNEALKLDDKYLLTVTPPAGGATLVYYVIATTKGNIKYSIKNTLNLAIKVPEEDATSELATLTNDKPVMKGLIGEIIVDAAQFEANSTYEDPSSYVYTSPIATDTESNEIKFGYSGETGKPYLKISKDASKA